jgi:hypothetical protein
VIRHQVSLWQHLELLTYRSRLQMHRLFPADKCATQNRIGGSHNLQPSFSFAKAGLALIPYTTVRSSTITIRAIRAIRGEEKDHFDHGCRGYHG